MDGHREPAADPERRRFVEQRALWLRQTFRLESAAPLERFCGLQRVDNDRINPLIVFPQVMIGPLHRIVLDEFRRIALSRRHGKIFEAAQIEGSARIGENCSEPFGIVAGGKAIDKRSEHLMHVVTAD